MELFKGQIVRGVLLACLLCLVYGQSDVSFPDTPLNYTCNDVCACLANITSQHENQGSFCLKIDGNRFHLQKYLHGGHDESCGSSDSVVEDGAYFECLDNELQCTRSAFNANFTESHFPQLRSTVDYVQCNVEEQQNESRIMGCVYKNATMPEQCEQPYSCVYSKPKRNCPSGWLHHNGLCTYSNTSEETQEVAKMICKGVGGELFGTSRRETKFLLDSLPLNTATWINETNEKNSDQKCWAFKNINGSESTGLKFEENCKEKLKVFCTKPAYKTISCSKSPELEVTQSGPSWFDDISSILATSMQPSSSSETTEASHLPDDKDAIDVPELTQNDIMHMSDTEKVTQMMEDFGTLKEEIKSYLADVGEKETKEIENVFSDVAALVVNEKTVVEHSSVLVQKLDDLMDILADNMEPAGEIVIETSSLVVGIVPTSHEFLPGGTYAREVANMSFSITLPPSIQNNATLAVSSSSILHETMPTTMENDIVTSSLASTIISVSVGTDNIIGATAETEYFDFTLPVPERLQTSEFNQFYQCSWIKPSTEEVIYWSTDGCLLIERNVTHFTCRCNHMTSFAVLMSVSPEQDPVNNDTLTLMTLVGCTLSIICLATMLLIFMVQKLWKSDRNIIHMNLALSLLIAEIIFLIGVEKTDNEAICKAVGMSLHYFFLGSFFWMFNEGVYLISKTRSQKISWLKLPTYLVIGWGCPLIVVGVTAGVSFKSYGIEERCWLTTENNGIWAFVGPAVAIIIINMGMLLNVIRVFLSLKANMKKKQVERTWLALRAMLLTLPLLGLTWLFGVLAFNSTTVVFAYLFVIFNSLQGVFIFILYCLLNDEVRKTVQSKMYTIGRMSGKPSGVRTSKTTA